MKKYLTFFRIRFISGLQYRSAAFAGIVTQFAWGFMEILMFRAFYTSDPASFPMGFSQLASYLWLQQAFLALFMTWFFDSDIFSAIMGGNIAYELSRPLDLYSMWFTKNLALRLSKAVLRCMPILIVAVILPSPYRLELPDSITVFLLFILSFLLGFLCTVSYSMLVYIAAFYTMNPTGIRIISMSAAEFLTGAVIPLPFFPQAVRKIIELTPFAYMQNLPYQIYSGSITGPALTRGLLIQFMWVLLLIAGGKFWITHALKHVVVQGG